MAGNSIVSLANRTTPEGAVQGMMMMMRARDSSRDAATGTDFTNSGYRFGAFFFICWRFFPLTCNNKNNEYCKIYLCTIGTSGKKE